MSEPIEHVINLPYPRERVHQWWLRPGTHERLSPPGWAEVVSGNADTTRVGDQIVVQPSHPLLSSVPKANLIMPGPVAATVDELREGEFISLGFKHGKTSWAEETHFEDGPDGGTTVRLRVVGGYPKQAAGAFGAQLKFLADQATADLALVERLDADPIHVVVAGSSGLVGSQLVALLRMAGHRVTRLVRGEPTAADEVRWDPTTGAVDHALVDSADAVVNLAGHTIGGRFNDKNKTLIMESRLDSTRTLAQALVRSGGAGTTLVQASAIGLYGARRPGETLGEQSPRGTGFLADVVEAWEAAAAPATEAGVRTVFIRTGIAQSYAGGALQRQVPIFLAGFGGPLAKAEQMQSWIGIDDLVRVYVHALFTPELEGPVNAVAPNPVTHGDYASTLGTVLRRPAAIPTPSFGPKLLLGGEGYDQLINTDQRVSADKLLRSGFEFTHPTLEQALRHTLLRPA